MPRGWLWHRQGWPDYTRALNVGFSLDLVDWGGLEHREHQGNSLVQTLEKDMDGLAGREVGCGTEFQFLFLIEM